MVHPGPPPTAEIPQQVKALLDTHFILWIVTASRRLSRFPWLKRYLPWVISPVSILEIQFLAEAGKVDLRAGFFEALRGDPRFVLDEPPFAGLVEEALPLAWTRDPFDRLLAAHSGLRRTPLCSIDDLVIAHHPLLVRELRP
jgi:PIN domain nuclease of toxin-antitoxin system